MSIRSITVITCFIVLVSGVLLDYDVLARTFRKISPINAPQTVTDDNAVPVQVLQPIDPALVKKAIGQIVAAWNAGELGDLLDDSFLNKERLLDTITEDVPKDAKMRILSIRGITTLNQQVTKDKSSNRSIVVSTVSAIVETRIEFNDPDEGFQSLNGTNEYILKATQTSNSD